MNFLDLICLISRGTLIRIVDQNLETVYFGRVADLESRSFDDSVVYHEIINFGKVVNIFHDDNIVIVVYLPY